jgi:hypothetical protein
LETFSLVENKLLYECKISWNIIMKGIEIFVLKSFSIIYVCVKSMVGEWCGILVINKKVKGERIFVETRT